jgi:signal peptidase I
MFALSHERVQSLNDWLARIVTYGGCAIDITRLAVTTFPLLTLLLVTLILGRATLLDWHPLPSGSMHPTLLEGDVLLVDRVAYDVKIPFISKVVSSVADPQRGDIVVFESPKDGSLLVKRIIGLPGDRVELRNKILQVNGQVAKYKQVGAVSDFIPVGAHWAAHDFEEDIGRTHERVRTLDDVFGANIEAQVVPPGNYLMLGDNRDNSADFRFFGFVPRELIQGKVFLVALSYGSAISPGFGSDRFWRLP